jgi:hypothetical protein
VPYRGIPGLAQELVRPVDPVVCEDQRKAYEHPQALWVVACCQPL